MFDGIDAEVGFELEVEFDLVGVVAGFRAQHIDQGLGDVVGISGHGPGSVLRGVGGGLGDGRAGVLGVRGAGESGHGDGAGGTRAPLLEDDVEVGAAEAEGGDAGAAGVSVGGFGPRFEFGLEVERRSFEGAGGVGGVEVDGRGEQSVVERQGGLDEGGGAGGAFEVTDLGFDGAEGDGSCAASCAPEFVEDGGFGGIADAGRGAVGFEEVDRIGVEGGGAVGAFDGAAWSGGIGGGDALAAAVAGAADGAEDGVDPIAGVFGVFEAFEDEGGAAFAHDEAVGAGVEGSGAVGGEGSDLAELDEGGGAHGGIGAAGDDDVAFAGAEGAGGGGDGGEGAGAGGVDGVVGAAEVEDIGDAAGDDVGQFAGHGVLGDVGQGAFERAFEGAQEAFLEFRREFGPAFGFGEGASELGEADAGGGQLAAVAAEGVAEDHGAAFAIDGGAGVAEGLIDAGEGEALAFVHRLDDGGGQSELFAVEDEPGDEPADLGVGAVGGCGVGGPVEGGVPAFGGDFAHSVAFLTDSAPELGGAESDGGECSQTHDCDIQAFPVHF